MLSGFADKLKESATQAAEAAQNFKGFDEMAAKDEYIHKEEFNVAGVKNKATQRPPDQPPRRRDDMQQQQWQQQQQQHQNNLPAEQWQQPDDNSTLSTHSSLAWQLDRKAIVAAAQNNNSNHNHSNNNEAIRPPQSLNDVIVPLKVSVPERQSSLPARDDSNNGLNVSDDDSYDEEDPIMSMIRKQRRPSEKESNNNKPIMEELISTDKDEEDHSSISERHLPHPKQQPEQPSNKQQSQQKKHRFMEDLDTRMAMPEQEMPPVSFAAESQPNLVESEQPVLSWLSTKFRGTSRNIGKQQQRPLVPALARAKPKAANPMDDWNNVAVVSSADLFGDEEMQKLAQLQAGQQQTPSRYVKVFEIVTQHPREAFIAFTILLGSFVYFYSRNRSLVD